MNITMQTKKILIISSDPRFMDRFAQESLVLVRVLLPEIVLIADDISDVPPVILAQQLRASVPDDQEPIVVIGLDHASLERSILSNDAPTPTSSQPRSVNPATPNVNGHAAHDSDEHRNGEKPSNLTCHDLRLDRDKHRVWVQDRSVRLTPTEFKLLWELASRPGYVLSRQELSQRCKRTDRAIQTRTVDAHIKSIRRKLQSRAGLIETVHGVGYRFLDIDTVSDN